MSCACTTDPVLLPDRRSLRPPVTAGRRRVAGSGAWPAVLLVLGAVLALCMVAAAQSLAGTPARERSVLRSSGLASPWTPSEAGLIARRAASPQPGLPPPCALAPPAPGLPAAAEGRRHTGLAGRRIAVAAWLRPAVRAPPA